MRPTDYHGPALHRDGHSDGAGEAGAVAAALAAARATAAQHEVVVPGTVVNVNTAEEFRALDKKALLAESGARIAAAVRGDGGQDALDDPAVLARFILVCFADLKNHRFIYWFGFPALVATPPPTLRSAPQPMPPAMSSSLTGAVAALLRGGDTLPASFVVLRDADGDGVAEALPLSRWATLDEATRRRAIVAFVDPCPLPTNPGWPLRNLLTLLSHRLHLDSATILCYRPHPGHPAGGLLLDVDIGAAGGDLRGSVVGWELNDRRKPGPRLMNLKSLLDPVALARASVNLNLNLMKWRALPTLDNERLAATRCLLFGAGTLGCYVARSLLAWGFQKITFVDNGRVSYSNPVRQPLFEFADCADGGKPKAEAAANALKRIFPDVEAEGVQLTIPMPGHPVPEVERAQVAEDVKRLEELVGAADVVFMLTDTRESRWLPTVLCAAADKPVLNVALGFDTYLVMRHGVSPGAGEPGPSPDTSGAGGAGGAGGGDDAGGAASAADAAALPAAAGKLGCYFCNDVVAPANSTRDRTLDQQCTVTRPGLAPIAGATAVELLVALLHHPDGAAAESEHALALSEKPTSPLGIVPHQIRGFLTHMTPMITSLRAFDRCTACSEAVVGGYKKDGLGFLTAAFDDPAYLERATGLDDLQAKAASAIAAWEGEDDEDGDDW